MFSRIKQILFGHVTSLTPVEKWAIKNANRTTPDEIIAAAIVQSFIKDFDKWQNNYFTDPKNAWYFGGSSGSLKNESKNYIIKRTPQSKGDKYRFFGMTINGVKISAVAERYIVEAYEKICLQVVKTQETAAKAKAAMERNEKAWDMVEDLLGLKRDSNGALVPKETKK